MKALDIREDFIKYFRQNSHKLLAPSKIFNDDPSLLFVNAGMNQLKDEFLRTNTGLNKPGTETGTETGARASQHKRLCNSQVCIRAGGKHNDLDDVGMDSYHLTSFEMLGNWSLDDYWKEDAIRLAYIYLTDHLGLDKSKLYVTYFEGDEKEGLAADEETLAIWLKYFPKSRIVKGNFKDNFWMMADSGPCGVSTEIHYDLSDQDRTVPGLVNTGDPSVIEIWNIVFIQFNRIVNAEAETHVYEKLDRCFVDTGMGLERLCMVLQKKPTIYKTDVFHYLMGYGQAISNCEHSYSDCYDPRNPQYNVDCAYRIFCDHFRTVVIALFYGVLFDVTGRGHVLRKIFRRMLTYLYLYLNNKTVEQLMAKNIIMGIISDILAYGLKRKHDVLALQKQLIDEELIFLGKLQHFQTKMKKILGLNDIDGCFDYVCLRNTVRDPDPGPRNASEKTPGAKDTVLEFKGNPMHLKEVEDMYTKLFRAGIPALIVTHARELKIKKIKFEQQINTCNN
jgi:alanyl-tRNA synthetase